MNKRGFATIYNTKPMKGSVGVSLQKVVKNKKKKLTEKEKVLRGIDCAKGSNLKFYPNTDK
jgi:hypothetical protein